MPLLKFWIGSNSKMKDYRAVQCIFLSGVRLSLKNIPKKLVRGLRLDLSLAQMDKRVSNTPRAHEIMQSGSYFEILR
jgi:hypothetical protein